MCGGLFLVVRACADGTGESAWAELAATFAAARRTGRLAGLSRQRHPAGVGSRTTCARVVARRIARARRGWRQTCCAASIRTPRASWVGRAASWWTWWPRSCRDAADVAGSAAARWLVDLCRLPGAQRQSPPKESMWRCARSGALPLPRLEDEQDRLSRGQLRVAESADGLLGYHVAVDERRGVHLPAGRDPCLASGGWPTALAAAGSAAQTRPGPV